MEILMEPIEFISEIRNDLMEASCSTSDCNAMGLCIVCETFIKVDTYISQETQDFPSQFLGPEELQSLHYFANEEDELDLEGLVAQEHYDALTEMDVLTLGPLQIRSLRGY
jgi:hypothetical protein